jgi:hypothetical protein
MVSKCANPACPATFRYLHDGVLFYVTVEAAGRREDGGGGIPKHERFWLCGECLRKLTVIADPTGILVVPLQPGLVPRNSGTPARPWDSA